MSDRAKKGRRKGRTDVCAAELIANVGPATDLDVPCKRTALTRAVTQPYVVRKDRGRALGEMYRGAAVRFLVAGSDCAYPERTCTHVAELVVKTGFLLDVDRVWNDN